MDEHIRVSDADRERVADRLRDHFAEGRLSTDELDERIAATLNAKTVGDLRWVTADLPGPAPVAPPGPPVAAPGRPRRAATIRRRPRIMPLLLIALIVAVAVSGAGSVLAVVAKAVLAIFLIAVLAGIFAILRVGWRLRRAWRDGYGRQWQAFQWHAQQWQRHQRHAQQWQRHAQQWRRQQRPEW